jgi:hypothetical protein
MEVLCDMSYEFHPFAEDHIFSTVVDGRILRVMSEEQIKNRYELNMQNTTSLIRGRVVAASNGKMGTVVANAESADEHRPSDSSRSDGSYD